MLRPKIGLDWDDVTAPFNSIAIAMANEKYHPKEPYRMEEITSWANEGRTSVIKEFYNDPELYVQVLSGNFTRTKNSMHASRFRRKTKKLCTA